MSSFILLRILRRVLSVAKKSIDFGYLKLCGVQTCYGYVRLNGFPLIRIKPGARIIMGRGVELTSTNAVFGRMINEAGVNHRVMLSALSSDSEIIIGNGVGMSGTSIVSCSRVEIGNNTLLGINTNVFDTDFHNLTSTDRHSQHSILEAPSVPIKIGDGCWIAGNVTILKGVTIGNGSTIGANSLVTKDIPSGVLAFGIPAVPHKIIQ